MIDVKINGERLVMHGKLDHATGLVFIEFEKTVQVETVQNLIARGHVLEIKSVPEEAPLLSFN